MTRQIIDSEFDKPIVLVGMMGVGKTTIGRRLAPKIGLPFFDADEQIEEAAGMSVSDLFTKHGEEHFRKGEAQVIRRLLENPPSVIATGGGAILNEETRQLIKDCAISVWLRAPVHIIARRATQRATRPLLKNGNPVEIITRLLEERTPYYSQADHIFDSLHGAHTRTVNALVKLLRSKT